MLKDAIISTFWITESFEFIIHALKILINIKCFAQTKQFWRKYLSVYMKEKETRRKKIFLTRNRNIAAFKFAKSWIWWGCVRKFSISGVDTQRSSLKKGFLKFLKCSERLVKILAIPIKKCVKKLVFTEFAEPTRLQLC